jgi:hypothetical protein
MNCAEFFPGSIWIPQLNSQRKGAKQRANLLAATETCTELNTLGLGEMDRLHVMSAVSTPHPGDPQVLRGPEEEDGPSAPTSGPLGQNGPALLVMRMAERLRPCLVPFRKKISEHYSTFVCI